MANMDSLKLPKTGSNSGSPSNTGNQKISGSIPITVRFNAGDECIDDLLSSFHHTAGVGGVGTGTSGGGGSSKNSGSGSANISINSGSGDSLSSSPSQHTQAQTQPQNVPEEINTRNNFLQSNFFNRKSELPGGKQQLSPNHGCPPPIEVGGGSRGPSSPVAIAGGGAFNGTAQTGVGGGGGGGGGVSPNSLAGVSPKYRRSMSFPNKGGISPTGYTLDLKSNHGGMPTLSIGNGGCGPTAGATGGGDVRYMGHMGNGHNKRMHIDMDRFNELMRNLNSYDSNGMHGGGEQRMRGGDPKMCNDGRLSEAAAVAIAGSNGAASFMDGNMKMASPSRASPHTQPPTDGMARYSRKVFVGGLPPDIDEDEITASFRRFGPLVVDWPHKAESKSYFPPKGYAFLLFQDENSVQQLIDSCITDEDKLYLCVSSPTIKDKPVQIRPWRLADADYVLDASMALDPRKTVFVGGVPRPLKAFELAMIMDRLYGGVCYAGIDTDPELKYPKGAGRVAFANQQSYIAAISARFVQLQHGDIDKRVEVKPYVLDDQMCDECEGQRCGGKFAPFFCANVTCLQYYCEHCWAGIHSRPGREYHKPLVKEGADRPRAVPFRWC